MANTIRHLIFLLLLVSGAFAQPPQQTVRFAVFSAKPIDGLVFSPRPGAEAEKIAFHPTTRSPRYGYRGSMPLQFVATMTGRVVAEATIPPDIHEALLLFTPLAAVTVDGLRYRIAVLDDSAVRHGPGGLAIINFSGLELGGTIGREAVTLKPGLNPTASVGRSTKISLRATFKGRSYQSYADTLQLGRDERALLILFPPFYPGSLEVQSRLLLDEPPGVPSNAK